jgi:hypothetical protein
VIPIELVYLLVAVGIGMLIWRYFTGHGGIDIVREDYAGLPAEGQIVVRHHQVRWEAAEDDSFVAAWQLASGHFVIMRVHFDEGDEDAPDQGHLELRVDKRVLAEGVGWTEKIRDRALRADVEAVLKVLAREARTARSDRSRLGRARSVGDDRPGGEPG